MATSLFSGISFWAEPNICLLLVASAGSCLNLVSHELSLGSTRFENQVSRKPKQEVLCEPLQGGKYDAATNQALALQKPRHAVPRTSAQSSKYNNQHGSHTLDLGNEG